MAKYGPEEFVLRDGRKTVIRNCTAADVDFFTETYWEKKIAEALREYYDGAAVRFVLVSREQPRTPIGTVNFTQLFREPFQACHVGYGIAAEHEGKGLMTEALLAAIDFLFFQPRVHRIMANHLPENHRSEKLLARLGFQREGLAKDYLLINGRWRDHVLNSKTNPHWTPN